MTARGGISPHPAIYFVLFLEREVRPLMRETRHLGFVVLLLTYVMVSAVSPCFGKFSWVTRGAPQLPEGILHSFGLRDRHNSPPHLDDKNLQLGKNLKTNNCP